MASFGNIPSNVVRREIIKHMNSKSAARFAAVCKEYRNNARARVAPAMTAEIRAAFAPKIDNLARKVAGRMIRTVAYIRKARRNGGGWMHHEDMRLPVLGFVRVSAVLDDAQDVLFVYTPGLLLGAVDVQSRRGHFVLSRPRLDYIEISRSRQWLIDAVVRRAVELYNQHPVSVNR